MTSHNDCCEGCGGGTVNHCESTAFDSSCSDEGQGFPLNIRVGCALPSEYVAVPGVVGVFDGEAWLLDLDSS